MRLIFLTGVAVTQLITAHTVVWLRKKIVMVTCNEWLRDANAKHQSQCRLLHNDDMHACTRAHRRLLLLLQQGPNTSHTVSDRHITIPVRYNNDKRAHRRLLLLAVRTGPQYITPCRTVTVTTTTVDMFTPGR